ncbi:ATP-binding protein [Azospirillaceae bacterium]
MIKALSIKNLTAFAPAEFDLNAQIVVLVGENGVGKTHIMKLLYSVLAVGIEERKKQHNAVPTKSVLQNKIAEKLVNVFRAETLGRLARRRQGRRRQGRERCDIGISFADSQFDIDFGFATNSKTEVSIGKLPSAYVEGAAIFLPTRELLSIFPNFIAVYDGHYLEFEETWRDACVLLGAPLQKGPREERIRELLAPLEQAMGGAIELDKNGRFYLRTSNGRMEIPLVAEGLRKLGMIARLITTGALVENGFLFWDEPEANLNPRLIKEIIRTILNICSQGVQVFVATHSLFLLREFEILLSGDYKNITHRFLGLHHGDDGVVVSQGSSPDEIGDITSLNEHLDQSDRFLELEL